jgi:apolipoprotein N-acyltransferase
MRPWLALATALAFSASTPPGWFPGSACLVLAALMGFYALATSSTRPLLLGYAVGLVHMAAFSFSLRHVSWAGYAGTSLVGAFYAVLAVTMTRRLPRLLPSPLAFGVAIAATSWLRAHMPEIPYPHGQPIHALWEWPSLLMPLRWGTEALGNLLLAAVAAAAVDLYRSWRVAEPPWKAALGGAWRIPILWAALVLVPPPGDEAARGDATVWLVEPRFPPRFQHADEFYRHLRDHVIEPTLQRAGAAATGPPDLVLWPESTFPAWLDLRDREPRLDREGMHVPLAPRTQLLAGTMARCEDGRRRVVGVLFDARGRVLGWHEKRCLVPAGEVLPFRALLPRFLVDWIEGVAYSQFGDLPDLAPGRPRPPLVAAGVPIGVMICYDNAFPAIAREHVVAGAQALVVLSNESWYRGGAELAQMVAMSVCRAIETGTPILRCTVDGASVQVTARGRVDWLTTPARASGAARGTGASHDPGRDPRNGGATRTGDRAQGNADDDRSARWARTSLTGREASLVPMVWVQDLTVALILVLAGLWLPQALSAWARLLRSRSGRPT